MSRTGRKIIPIPDKVKVKLAGEAIEVEGPLGKLSRKIHPIIKVVQKDKSLEVQRGDDQPQTRSLHGLTRALVANMVHGVTEGFTRELDIQGVGYRAEVKGNDLNLTLGFSHPVVFPIPTGIKITVDKQTHLVVKGQDRELVGQVAANIRELRPPEPYKGKGIRYSDEVVRRKAGKTAAGGK
ncbi:50S ribosomal protein L6 [Deltaproteobacteria bacterium PRO3]|nr:50S ribosomal protein L6 [Deltaproteobacteria bacterium PRO3]